MKTWQRRICEVPSVEDLTKLEVGTEYVWDSREVVICPSCKRPGVKYKHAETSGIVHSVDEGKMFRDYCVQGDFIPGSPSTITFDIHGNVTGEFRPTSNKVGGSN